MLRTVYMNFIFIAISIGIISCSHKPVEKASIELFAYSKINNFDTLTQETPPLIIMSAYLQKVIDQSNESMDKNHPITFNTYNASNNQFWKIKKTEGGFIISSFLSGKSLSVNRKDTTIEQQFFEKGNHQIWNFYGNGDSLRIQNMATNLFLSLGASEVTAEPRDKDELQLWRILTPQDYLELLSKCNCQENLNFIQSTMESSYAGFPDKVNQKTKSHYDSLTATLTSKARNITRVDTCYQVIEKYIGFFNDKHVGINTLQTVNLYPPKVYNKVSKDRNIKISNVDENTIILTIPSFSEVEYVENFLRFHFEKFTNTPNLIIDLRNNGGGDDRAWKRLVPYIYTNPIHSKGNEIRSSDQIIKKYELDFKFARELDIPQEHKEFLSDLLKRMKSNRGKFVTKIVDHTTTLNFVTKNPQKVILLINEHCGSSCEEFILTAKQSKKVVLMGQNTSGCLDYSNVFTVNCPSPALQLKYASTRSNRLPEYSVDKEGIQPDIYLKHTQDWIKEAVKEFEKMKPYSQI